MDGRDGLGQAVHNDSGSEGDWTFINAFEIKRRPDEDPMNTNG